MTPWLKVRCDIHEDAAVVAAALTLEISENEVVGALVKFWSWANRQTCDGNAPGVTKTWLDRYVCVTGFSDALVAVGWLDADEDGIAVPKFDRHNGGCAKSRAQTLKRVETYRTNGRDVKRICNARGVTDALQKALPEEEIEEEKKEELPPPPHDIASAGKTKSRKPSPAWDGGLPEELDSPAFRELWLCWERHRRAKRSPLTADCRASQLKKLAAMGPERAAAAVTFSLEQGYTGIFEPKPTAASRTSPATDERQAAREAKIRAMYADIPNGV